MLLLKFFIYVSLSDFALQADESEKQLKKRLRFTKRGREAACFLFVYNK